MRLLEVGLNRPDNLIERAPATHLIDTIKELTPGRVAAVFPKLLEEGDGTHGARLDVVDVGVVEGVHLALQLLLGRFQ